MYYKADDDTPRIQSFYEAGMLIGDTQGWIRGYETGCSDGAMKKAKDVARNLLAAGIPVETIASCVGLSIENVISIAEKMSASSSSESPAPDSTTLDSAAASMVPESGDSEQA